MNKKQILNRLEEFRDWLEGQQNIFDTTGDRWDAGYDEAITDALIELDTLLAESK